MRPPRATGRPGGIADREQHAGPEEVLRPAAPVDEAETRVGQHLLGQLAAPWPGRPSRRAPSPGGTGARRRRRSRASAGSRGPGRRRASASRRSWYHSTARSMASSSSERRLWSRPASWSSCSVMPARSARKRTASTKSRWSMARTKVMASPDCLAAEAVVEALLGVDAERGRLLGVEGAQPAPAPADLLQRGVLADERHDVGGRPDLGHFLVRYPHTLTVPRRCPAPFWPTVRRDGRHGLRRLRPDLHDGHVRPGGARPGVRPGLRPRLRPVELLRLLVGGLALRRRRGHLDPHRAPALPARRRPGGRPSLASWPAPGRLLGLRPASTAWAAARRATGTRKGEQLT